MVDTTKLSDDDLLSCLGNFCNFPISAENLKIPSFQFLKGVFECFLMDLQNDALPMNVNFNKMYDVLDYMEIYEDSMDSIVYLSKARYIMGIAGFPDLGVSDLQTPKPKRTKKILTYLVSLWNHVLQKYRKFKSIEDKMQDENDKLHKLHSNMLRLDQQLQDLSAQKVNPAQYEQQQKYNTTLDKQIIDKEKEMSTLQESNKNLKKDITERKNNIREMEVAIVTEKEHLEELEASILKSPQRLTSDIQSMKDRVVEEEEALASMKQKVKDHEKQIEVRRNLQEKIEKALASLKDCQMNCTRLNDKFSVVATQLQRLDCKEKELQESERSLATKSTSLQLLDDKMNHLDMQQKSKVQSLQTITDVKSESLDKALSTLSDLEAMERNLNKEIDVVQTSIDKAENQIKNVEQKTCTELLAMRAKYDECMQKLHDDNAETKRCLKKISNDLM